MQGKGQGGLEGQDRASRATDRTEPTTLVEVAVEAVSISQKLINEWPTAGSKWERVNLRGRGCDEAM